jgi:hypothetical protein
MPRIAILPLPDGSFLVRDRCAQSTHPTFCDAVAFRAALLARLREPLPPHRAGRAALLSLSAESEP